MKALVYRIYFFYFKKFPIQRGKTLIGNVLFSLLGNAIFKIKNCLFQLNPNSLIDRYLLIEGDYEEEIFLKASSAVAEGGIFLDIGANFGLFTIQLAKIKGVNVISFEPSPRELTRLFYHLQINNLNNVVIFPYCLGDENAKIKLNVFDESNPGKNSVLPLFNSNKIVEVDCYRIEDLINFKYWEKIKFIKIDVEGLEYQVLNGMGTFLDSYKGTIAIEITYSFLNNEIDHYDPNKIYELLEAKGFVAEYGRNL